MSFASKATIQREDAKHSSYTLSETGIHEKSLDCDDTRQMVAHHADSASQSVEPVSLGLQLERATENPPKTYSFPRKDNINSEPDKVQKNCLVSNAQFNLQQWENENIFPNIHATYTDTRREEARERIAKTVEKYSDELVEQWNKEIDGLLTFAGLFSAILSAFNVQSYQLLQPAASDQTNALLTQVSNQLSSFRTASPFLNSTQPAYNNLFPSPPPFVAPIYAIWMNTLWFVSLVFSLASASIGIIVKQWIKEYNTGLYGFSHEIGRRRQYRLNNLEKWHVAEIVAIVPLLLLIAVVLFLAGLVILLYSLHGTVASITSFIGGLLLFVTATTLLPTLSKSCCYYSPQAYALFQLWKIAFVGIRWVSQMAIECFYQFFRWATIRRDGWRLFDWLIGDDAYQLFLHLRSKVMDLPIWRGGEQDIDAENPDQPAVSTMITAYAATLDTKFLDDSIASLTSTADANLWGEYFTSLINLLHSRGSPVYWPSRLKAAFSMLLVTTNSIYVRESMSNPPHAPQNDFTSLWNTVAAAFTDGEGTTQDSLMLVAALMAANRQYDAAQADQAWSRYFYLTYRGNMQEAITYRTVIAATAERLSEFAYGPAHRPSSFQYGVVEWDLNFVLQHVYVLHKALHHPRAESGPDWLPAISPVITYAFDMIQIIFGNLDMQASDRHLGPEVYQFYLISEEIEDVLRHSCGKTIFTPVFFASLTETFERLLGVDDWRNHHSDEIYAIICTSSLTQLESKFYPPTALRPPGEPMNHDTD